MGVDPSAVMAAEGGRHATPEEFHALVSECMDGTGMFFYVASEVHALLDVVSEVYF